MTTLLFYFTSFSAGYLALTLSLYALSMIFPLAAFFARLLASYISLVICACYGVLVSLLLRPLGLHRSSQWATARAFKYIMYVTTGIEFVVSDPESWLQTRPSVFIANHQTELDVLMLGSTFPKHCSVTAKRSLKNVPFLGWFMQLSGSVFIDRANSRNAREAMSGAVDEMVTERQSVFMFPEGTRSYPEEPILLPFKKGAFHLAVQAGVPIVPIVVANYSNVLFARKWRFNGGKIAVKVLKPIETTNLTASDVEDLARDTRDLMLRELLDLTAKSRGIPISIPAQNAGDGVVKASGIETTIS
ncbi:hypothetical protein B7494_g741 [Chlorociboria aeruginascens]|nr:hypothetical protein B7494_g741 [Chlorociboria aeruginascens]